MFLRLDFFGNTAAVLEETRTVHASLCPLSLFLQMVQAAFYQLALITQRNGG